MTTLVNLDAHILREDFRAQSPAGDRRASLSTDLKFSELNGNFRSFFRKPDFQRTTAHWSPEKVVAFIKSFLEEDLIPSIIVWRSPSTGNVFVIDGAHRLSAALAWIFDDYGDGVFSKAQFTGSNIPAGQRLVAAQTRQLIKDQIGTYRDVSENFAGSQLENERKFASTLTFYPLRLHWVEGDAARAEKSFHTINTQQTPIGRTELRLIRDRRSANVISARAIIGAAIGNHSDFSFNSQIQAEIRNLAEKIHQNIQLPEGALPIRSIDLPSAKSGYTEQAVTLVLDLVEHINHHPKAPKSVDRASLDPTTPADIDGLKTVEYLQNTKRVISRIAGKEKTSLGLHPLVYYHTATGAFQPSAFIAIIDFINDLESRHQLILFTKARSAFEDLLVAHNDSINRIINKYGAKERSHQALGRFYKHLYDVASGAESETPLHLLLQQDDKLTFLASIIDPNKQTKVAFSNEKKAAIAMRASLSTALRCHVCHARTVSQWTTNDHVQDISDGGRGDDSNGALVHPFCNGAKRAIQK